MAAAADSRQRMIEAAIQLMRGSGLSGAGINEVVRESAAPKGSVYHFFPGGKQQLVAEALTDYSTRVMQFIDDALADAKDGPAKLKRLFEAFARRVESAEFLKSCAFGAVCLDLDDGEDALRPVIADAFEAWTRLIAGHFDLGTARRTQSFARLVLSSIEGAYILARAEQSGRAFREAGEWLAQLLPAGRVGGRAVRRAAGR